MIPEINDYIDRADKWQAEMKHLRGILLNCMLKETFKWKAPCYTYKGKNIAMIAYFKIFCAISFFKGELLQDHKGLLHSPGKNSQSVKYLKFINRQEIIDAEETIKSYIYEAIEVEMSGLKINKETQEEWVDELVEALDEDPLLKKAFYKLTPGRQRGYNIYISGAKQSSTRKARVVKYIDRIMKGKGIHDCVCGQSKRMPTCDGSHKHI